MTQLLLDILRFFSFSTIIVVATCFILFFFISLLAKGRIQPKLKIKKINDLIEKYKNALVLKTSSKKELKDIEKNKKKNKKLKKKNGEDSRSKLFIINFKGDVKASAVESLREEVTALLSVATKNDKVLVNIDSPGGMVHTYGLAASQLKRIRDKGITLVAAVDKVAASGGYLMACVANEILAAPFAIVGSIGVLAQVPNFNKLLKKHDIEFKEITAGEYKRTLSPFGEITEKGVEKFRDQIEQTHTLFKNFVSDNRPQLDVPKIATGEYWYGTQAIELKLVDKIQTSDDYLMDHLDSHNIYSIEYRTKKTLAEKIGETSKALISQARPEEHLNRSKEFFM